MHRSSLVPAEGLSVVLVRTWRRTERVKRVWRERLVEVWAAESACGAGGCGGRLTRAVRGLSVVVGRIGVAKPQGVRVMVRGPVEVATACEAALLELGDAFASSEVTGSLE